MIVCSCNIITEQEIREVIIDLLNEEEWRLIVPAQVYHVMEKRGRCCGCFPAVSNLIVQTTERYHRDNEIPECEIILLVGKLKEKQSNAETLRAAAQRRMLENRMLERQVA